MVGPIYVLIIISSNFECVVKLKFDFDWIIDVIFNFLKMFPNQAKKSCFLPRRWLPNVKIFTTGLLTYRSNSEVVRCTKPVKMRKWVSTFHIVLQMNFSMTKVVQMYVKLSQGACMSNFMKHGLTYQLRLMSKILKRDVVSWKLGDN